MQILVSISSADLPKWVQFNAIVTFFYPVLSYRYLFLNRVQGRTAD